MYDEAVQSMPKTLTTADLVERLHGLRGEKRQWREAGDQLEKRITQAEAEIQSAMEFLKNGLEGNPQNGAIAYSPQVG